MGTRHLICVKEDGKNKVAQYGQWDGYPAGQGVDILKFLKDKTLFEEFKKKLKRVRFLDSDGKDKKFIESYNKNAPEWSNEPDNRTPEQIYWWNTFMHRDLGAKILPNISKSTDDEIILHDDSTFVNDNLMCEYCYIINLAVK